MEEVGDHPTEETSNGLAEENEAAAQNFQERHKRERKELQAKITQLKHAINKNDKKQKKEVQAQIAKLEAELDEKQRLELADLSLSVAADCSRRTESPSTSDVQDEAPVADNTMEQKQRISKAQKRRDKKEVQDKEREKAIAEQERINLAGPRYVESEAIRAKLAELGLVVHEIPADGDCLYGAISHQLQLCGMQRSVQELRKMTADCLRENRDEFAPFLTDPDTGEMLTADGFEAYCKKIEKTTCWGGQPEILALSMVLQQPIRVIQSNAADICTGSDKYRGGLPLTITYHHHMYRLGQHYNSVEPRNQNIDTF